MTKSNFNKISNLVVPFILGGVAAVSVDMSFVVLLGLYSVAIACFRPNYMLALSILLLPFGGTYYFTQNVGGLPGLKVVNFLMMLLLFVFLSSGQQNKIKVKELMFIIGVLAFISISVFRSLPYLETINAYRNEGLGVARYVASYLVKPALYMVPFFIIVSYVRDKKKMDIVFRAISLSLALLSCVILMVYFFNVVNTGNFRVVRSTIGYFFGMHGNTLAEFYVIGYPLILSRFLYKKNVFSVVSLSMAIVCIALLYSRSAYAITLFSTVAMLVMNKKKKWLPVFVLLAILGISMAPSTVVERGLTGIYGVSRVDMHEVSAGRIENIWIPLLESLQRDGLMAILVGRGKFSVAFSSDIIWGHAHNMYLEALSDIGLVGLLFFVGYYLSFLKNIYRQINITKDEEVRTVLQGVFISALAWLITGMVGRHFFPELQNSFLWVLLGTGLALVKMREVRLCNEEEKKDLLCGTKRLPFTPR